MTNATKILKLDGLKTHFHTFEGVAKAVDDVSFDLSSGETLGIVGESGSGKSVTALSIMGLIPQPPGKIAGGRILFKGTDLLTLEQIALRGIRGDRISMIFQEPMTSLNPLFTVGYQISEMFLCHRGMDKKESWERAVDMLGRVQIPAPAKRAKEYPHQLSGGMRQRVMIAMALACDPEILIADEPTTALDVTIQAQIINLLMDLQEEFDLSYIFVSHDLAVVEHVSDRIMVMYLGKIVESAPYQELYSNPLHPYTQALLSAVPIADPRERVLRIGLKGDVPSPLRPPSGCAFHPRCKLCAETCEQEAPQLIEHSRGHWVACHMCG